MDAHQVKRIKTKYKDKMLQLAFIVSGWSTEPEGQRHGTILAMEGKWIIATGFNGQDRTWAWPKPDPKIVHSEENAIINAKMVGVDLTRNIVAYITKRPCDACEELLRREGIKMAFWLQDLRMAEAMWTT